mmetsp:Transcript_84204/g.168086  ORF Transcript_84204/g.168086 Transcript_84204/m.168086 type:complete len:245 (-) Transcript_84204:189-923(-)
MCRRSLPRSTARCPPSWRRWRHRACGTRSRCSLRPTLGARLARMGQAQTMRGQATTCSLAATSRAARCSASFQRTSTRTRRSTSGATGGCCPPRRGKLRGRASPSGSASPRARWRAFCRTRPTSRRSGSSARASSSIADLVTRLPAHVSAPRSWRRGCSFVLRRLLDWMGGDWRCTQSWAAWTRAERHTGACAWWCSMLHDGVGGRRKGVALMWHVCVRVRVQRGRSGHASASLETVAGLSARS